MEKPEELCKLNSSIVFQCTHCARCTAWMATSVSLRAKVQARLAGAFMEASSAGIQESGTLVLF